MTQSVPPDPQNRNERQDELIAVFLALAAVGGILFWGMSRGGDRSFIAGLQEDAGDTSSSVIEAEPDGEGTRSATIGRDRDDSDSVAGGLDSFLGGVFSGGEVENEEISLPRSRNPSRSDRDGRVAGAIAPLGSANIDPTPLDETDVATTQGETGSVGVSPDAPEEVPVTGSNSLPTPTDFTDIGADFWAKSYIDNMSQLGIVEGFPNGTFRPDADVTRAEFASSIRQAFAESGDVESVEYADISTDFWAKESIDKASQLNFMSGYPDDSFRPTNPVTRLEVIIALATGLDLDVPNNPDAILETYSDREEIPDWAIEKIAAATSAGMVISHPDVNRFEPNAPATRAEATSMIYLALANSRQDLEAIPSYYRVEP